MTFQLKISYVKVNLFAILIIVLHFHSTNIQAQSENSNWFFGKNAGITFRSGIPVPLEEGQLNTMEGCATISDSVGNLLFYTDGITVWNKHHYEMSNGKGLNGHISSTQSAYIVPQPGSDSLYYIFTSDFEAGIKGLCYSLINMNLNKGLGEITAKNILLRKNCVEKIAAYQHANNKDIWLVIHEYNSNAFLSYLISKKGISEKPVVSEVGIKYENSIYNTIGYMKFSPNGKKLATVITGSYCAQILDFDNKTGQITNPINLELEKNSMPYGLEFSPNSKLLYIGTGAKGNIYQFDTDKENEKEIAKSVVLVGKSLKGKSLGALQLAEDNKIYVVEYMSKYLSVIEDPDKQGTNCSFNVDKINLNRIATFGLPVCYHKFRLPKFETDAIVYNKSNNILINQKYRLNNILFETDKSEIRQELFKDLDQVVSLLKSSDNLRISIIGHTDSIGKEKYNYRLSLRRANEVKDYLLSNDIKKKQVSTIGKGYTEPVDSNSTETGRERNRRVEFIITYIDEKQKAEL